MVVECKGGQAKRLPGSCLFYSKSRKSRDWRWGLDMEGRWKRKRMPLNSRINSKVGAWVEGALVPPASVL